MTKRMEIYKCELCGNIVEMIHQGAGSLVCCNRTMKKFEEQWADFSTEKHVPIVEILENSIIVTVGSTLHPMEKDHYIEWIEVVDGEKILRQHLNPGDTPKTEFNIKFNDNLIIREYCNKHGLWKS